jgi:hypothetical protein
MNIDDKATLELLSRVCATAIANQAILKCALARLPLTVDTVLPFVGDFYDPANESLRSVTAQIEDAILSVLHPDAMSEKVRYTANQN